MSPLAKFRTILSGPALAAANDRQAHPSERWLSAIVAISHYEHGSPFVHCLCVNTRTLGVTVGCGRQMRLSNQGFKSYARGHFVYLAPIHWIKPSGIGNYVIHRSQTLLLGYYERCIFDKLRYFPNLIQTKDPVRHSQKPEAAYDLIETVSHKPRLELFSRVAACSMGSMGKRSRVKC